MQWDIMQAEEIEVQVQWSGYVGEDDCTTHQQWSGAQLDATEREIHLGFLWSGDTRWCKQTTLS